MAKKKTSSRSFRPHLQWATVRDPERLKNGEKPWVCLWGDKPSAVEGCDADERVCRVRVEVLKVL